MKIYTASWFTYFGPGRIGISRGSPRGVAGGYKMYRALAPTRDILQNENAQAAYRERFFAEVLDKLDPQDVLVELEKRSQDGLAVMMCFEKPPFHENNWCHRRMVAEFLERETGLVVEEWSGVQDSNPQQARLDV